MSEKTEWPGEWAKHRRKTPIPKEAEKVRKWLRKTMKERKVTHAALAERIGVAPSHITRIATGCSELRVSTLVRIVEALGYRMVFIPEDKIREARERKNDS